MHLRMCPPMGRDAGRVLLGADQTPYMLGACQQPVSVFSLSAVDCVQADDVVPGQSNRDAKSHARNECLGQVLVQPVQAHHAVIGMPPLSVTGLIGAVGNTKSTCGNPSAHSSAMSAHLRSRHLKGYLVGGASCITVRSAPGRGLRVTQ